MSLLLKASQGMFPSDQPPAEGWPIWMILVVSGLATLVFGALLVFVTALVFKTEAGAWRRKTDFGVSGVDFLVMVFIWFGMFLLAPSASQLITNYAGKDESSAEVYHAFIIWGSLFQLIFPPAFLLHRRRRKDAGWEVFRLKPALGKAWRLGPVFAAWLPLAFALMWLSYALAWQFGGATGTQEVLETLMTPSRWQAPAAFLSAVVAAPVVEEFAFRAGLQGFMRRHMGFIPAAMLTTVVFVLLHMPRMGDGGWQWQYFLPILGLGLSLAWVFERSRNIWIAVFLHAMHNGLTLLLSSLWAQEPV